MTRVLSFSTAGLALCVCVVAAAADEQASPRASADQEEIQVMDLVIVSTNRVTVGTNTMSLAAATNLVASQRDTLDVVAVHGSVEGDASVKTKSSAVAEIARVGVPLVIVEKDGEYSLREQSGAEGISTVKIGTDQFAVLRRLWKRGKRDAETPSSPMLMTVRYLAKRSACSSRHVSTRKPDFKTLKYISIRQRKQYHRTFS